MIRAREGEAKECGGHEGGKAGRRETGRTERRQAGRQEGRKGGNEGREGGIYYLTYLPVRIEVFKSKNIKNPNG